MAMLAPESGKSFSKPATGKYIGTVIDVVDLGLCKSKNPQFPEPTHRIQIIWVLNVEDKDGKPVEYSEAPPFKIGEGGGKFKPSRLYQIGTGVFGGAIARPFDVESLLGRSNELFIVKTGNDADARSEIAGFLPVPPGVTPPTAPADFVRKINRPVAGAQAAQAAPTQQAAPAQSKEVQF